MVTIYEVAKRCGVSASTVSKAINDYPAIPEETKARIKKAMAEMKYVPNLQAKSLSRGKSKNIGILVYMEHDVSPFTHPLFGQILDSFSKKVSQQGYNLLFVTHYVEGKREPGLLKCIMSRNVEGVVILGEMDNENVLEIINSPIKCVGFDYYGTKMPGICTDGYAALKQVTEELLKRGHRNIAFITGKANKITDQRIKGFQDALFEYKVPFDRSNLLEGEYFNQDKAIEITASLLERKNRPTAIIYPDDYTAIAAMGFIRSRGLSIPKDISVFGFDGLEMAKYVTPRLSTVVQDTKALGEELSKALIEEMSSSEKHGNVICLPGKLSISDSIGSVN